MKHYMTEVHWNETGNKVRLVLDIPWRPAAEAAEKLEKKKKA